MKFLILAHRADLAAVAVAAALTRRHPAGECRLVTAEELVFAPWWAHRVDDADGASSEVRLHDGTRIASAEIGVVLHRLRTLDLPQFGGVDREYARAEMAALLQSWLEGFPCPVINPVTMRGFAGDRTPMAWLALATRAGLPVPRLHVTSSLRRFPADGSVFLRGPSLMEPRFALLNEATGPDTHSVLFAGDDVCGPLPPGLLPSCREFARLAQTPLVRLHFTSGGRHGAQWMFSRADPFPMLDAPGLEAVVRHLEGVASLAAYPQAEVA